MLKKFERLGTERLQRMKETLRQNSLGCEICGQPAKVCGRDRNNGLRIFCGPHGFKFTEETGCRCFLIQKTIARIDLAISRKEEGKSPAEQERIQESGRRKNHRNNLRAAREKELREAELYRQSSEDRRNKELERRQELRLAAGRNPQALH